MHELFLGLFLFLAPLTGEALAVAEGEPAPWAEADPCDVARTLGEQGACLRPEDCRAFEGWMRLFGVPRAEPLDPRLSEREERPRTFPCPARPGGRRAAGERPGS